MNVFFKYNNSCYLIKIQHKYRKRRIFFDIDKYYLIIKKKAEFDTQFSVDWYEIYNKELDPNKNCFRIYSKIPFSESDKEIYFDETLTDLLKMDIEQYEQGLINYAKNIIDKMNREFKIKEAERIEEI